MKNIEFQDQEALKVYQNYIARIKKVVAGLSLVDQNDILMEFNSHIYEGLLERRQDGELSTILWLTEKLGNPEIVLIPLVAEKQETTPSGDVKSLAKMTTSMSRICSAALYLLLSVFYLSMFVLILLCVAKLFVPEKVGLWFGESGFKGFGLDLRSSHKSSREDVLKHWFIPVVSAVIYMLYLIVRTLKAKRDHAFLRFSLSKPSHEVN